MKAISLSNLIVFFDKFQYHTLFHLDSLCFQIEFILFYVLV